MLKEDDRSPPSTFHLPLFPLAGAAVLAGLALASLPWNGDLFRRPRTLFDRSAARAVAPGYALVAASIHRIPAGAAVVVRTEPRDPVAETYYHRFADALLPGRRAIPAAVYGQFSPPELARGAEYVLIVGPRPPEGPGELVLAIPEGTVWRVRPPTRP
jgi:hypothetical protein